VAARPLRARHQLGAALLVLLALIGVVASLTVVWVASGQSLEAERTQNTARNMGLIRDALIARAAADLNRPGSLPCPDVDNDGQSTPIPDWSGSTCASYLGRVPWKTLDLPDLRDADGERFWYALSPVYRDSASAGTLNSDTSGALTVVGTQPASDVVAIVLAPGTPVGSQDRLASPTARESYLEGDNANGDQIYETGVNTATFNDRVLAITRDMLMPTVEQRVARQARKCLQRFAYPSGPGSLPGRYPFAAPMSDVVTYADTSTPGGPPFTVTEYGRIPSTVVATNDALGGTTYSWPNDDPQPGASPTACFASGTWWDFWRELLLYRVSTAYSAVGSGTCATSACLTVNSQNEVKFVVIVAGRKLSNPNQATRDSDKSNLVNYLETADSPMTGLPVNNADLGTSFSVVKVPRAVTAASSGAGFNDRVECVHETGAWPCD
jgi:type II secretory pathway pseudopilin PulG